MRLLSTPGRINALQFSLDFRELEAILLDAGLTQSDRRLHQESKTSAWKQGPTVNVMIDLTFSPTQQQSIKDQFDKSKTAGGANVSFKFVDPSQAGGGATTGGPPVLAAIRQVPDKKGGPQHKVRRRDFRGTERAGILP